MTTEERWTKRAPASRAASSASRVPRTLTSQKPDSSLGIPTSAAVWMTTSQPSAARCQGPGAAMSPATIPALGVGDAVDADHLGPVGAQPRRDRARR